MDNKIRFFRWFTLTNYFGLLTIIYIWVMWLQPPEKHLIAVALLIHLGPLMFPLRGLLRGLPYTHAWSSYLALLYLVLGVWYASAPASRNFGILLSILSAGFFIGAVFYARFKSDALKQQKPSD